MGMLSAAYKYSYVAFGVFDARLNKPCDRTLNEKLLEIEVELFFHPAIYPDSTM
jgi:hypothetical protein